MVEISVKIGIMRSVRRFFFRRNKVDWWNSTINESNDLYHDWLKSEGIKQLDPISANDRDDEEIYIEAESREHFTAFLLKYI